jgi:hypothetical protein
MEQIAGKYTEADYAYYADTAICELCLARAGSLGWHDPKEPRVSRIRYQFCDMTCVIAWLNWTKKGAMIDLNDKERRAIGSAMKNVGEACEEIGWNTQLSQLQPSQIAAIIEASIEGYTTAMRRMANEEGGEDPILNDDDIPL